MRFIDLFAGLGGFRIALERLGHECVFASEIDPRLQEVYRANFPEGPHISGDIRLSKQYVPSHDILCAGFPCQPFSKSGTQLGLADQTSGTLFHEIADIIRHHRPAYVLMENVGNFERHDKGRTWKVVKSTLTALDYDVLATEHIASGGQGLLSPHHLGFPHHRDRFYIVASRSGIPKNVFPSQQQQPLTSIADIVQPQNLLSSLDVEETQIGDQHRRCINHWNSFLHALCEDRITLPSFPIWGDELDATYPYKDATPWAYLSGLSNGAVHKNGHAVTQNSFQTLPRYAQSPLGRFPQWKIRFIAANRAWFSSIQNDLPPWWIESLRSFPPSLRKLEWNCQGEDRNLWEHILQFRPSGLRVKRYTTSPSLVAMTSTQIPILGPQDRHLSRVEGLRLQGFPDSFRVPDSRTTTFKALGNAVHVDVVHTVAKRLLCDHNSTMEEPR